MRDRSYNCEKCRDSGWVLSKRVKNTYVRCSCYRDLQVDRLVERSNIPQMFRDVSLSDFPSGAGEKSHLQRSVSQVTEYCLTFGYWPRNLPTGLLIQGNFGVGKTHLACAVLNELVNEKQHSVYFVDFAQFLNRLRSTFNPDSDITNSEVLEPVLRSDVLLIDDLGAEKPSEWVEDILGMIVNTRYLERKPVIITTNYIDPLETLLQLCVVNEEEAKELAKPLSDYQRARGKTLEQRIGPRLRSRIYEMCLPILLFGKDRRKEIGTVQR